MKFRKKILSSILAGTCMLTPAKKQERTQGMSMLVGGIIVAAVLGVVGYLAYRAYKEEQAELNRRNTLLRFSNAPKRVKTIARYLVHKIPCSSVGNSMFDTFLSCKDDHDITTWSGLVAAESSWDSSTLFKIYNTIKMYEINCSVLLDEAKRRQAKEKEDAERRLEREKMWQKERIENRKISSKERENEKDREYDREKQIRQLTHENYMQDKQHWHENDLINGQINYKYSAKGNYRSM